MSLEMSPGGPAWLSRALHAPDRETRSCLVSLEAWIQAADTSSWISAEQQDAAAAEHPEDFQCQNRRSKVN
jgi:hypothetical protein